MRNRRAEYIPSNFHLAVIHIHVIMSHVSIYLLVVFVGDTMLNQLAVCFQVSGRILGSKDQNGLKTCIKAAKIGSVCWLSNLVCKHCRRTNKWI